MATTTSTPTMPAEMPLLSRTDCEWTTSRRSFGVSTTTRLRLACSSSYDISCLRLLSVCRNQGSGKRITKDRKSTRLNSSHSQISYAVFCLKKKKHKTLMYQTAVLD